MDEETNIEDLIIDAVYTLSSKGSSNSKIIIAYSRLIKSYIEMSLNKKYGFEINIKDKSTYMGVEMYSNHPYNEIVIYDKDKAAYEPEAIIKIEFTNITMGKENKVST